MPTFSIVMSVYNGQPYLAQAIESMLKQTFRDFEFIIIDDNSTDGSQDVIRSFKDPRIRFIQNEKNLGLAQSLNRGLDEARGNYIARMDADDISKPNRLALQFEYLESHPGVGILGTLTNYIHGGWMVKDYRPTTTGAIRAYMLFANPMVHPAVCMRKSLIEAHGLRYDTTYSRSEDYDLWSRALEHTEAANLEQALFKCRIHKQSVTKCYPDDVRNQTRDIIEREWAKYGESFSREEIERHLQIVSAQRLASIDELMLAKQWLLRLVLLNDQKKHVDGKVFLHAVHIIWFKLCFNCGNLGLSAWRVYHQLYRPPDYPPPGKTIIRFFASCLFYASRNIFKKSIS